MGTLKVHTVEKARIVHVGLEEGEVILIGEKYYWTKANFHKKKVCSKNRAAVERWITNYANSKRGEHSTNLENWNSQLESLETQEEKESLLEEINEFLDQKRENLENMPEALQEGHVLNEQIEELEQLIEEVESVELEDED